MKLASQGGSWRAGGIGAAAALVAIAAIAGLGYGAGWRLHRPAPAVACLVNGAIASATRQALDRAALDFVAAVSGKDPAAAYAMLAAPTRDAVSQDKFNAAVHGSLDAVAPFRDVQVTDAYFIRMAPGADARSVACGADPSGVVAAAKPLPQQAHIVVVANSKQGQWDFVLWLVPEKGWRVAGFDFVATEIGGKSLAALRAMARDQHAAHHDLNAMLLYEAAARLAHRGPNLALPAAQAIRSQLATLPVPAYLHGTAPLHWRIDGDDFTVDNIGAAGVGNKLYVAVTQELSPWRDDADADTRNRLLISDFTRAAPEYAASFSGLIVLARDHAGAHVYRTVATGEAQTKAGK